LVEMAKKTEKRTMNYICIQEKSKKNPYAWVIFLSPVRTLGLKQIVEGSFGFLKMFGQPFMYHTYHCK
jgi:hypothetical protein